jgi:hypothetical protein
MGKSGVYNELGNTKSCNLPSLSSRVHLMVPIFTADSFPMPRTSLFAVTGVSIKSVWSFVMQREAQLSKAKGVESQQRVSPCMMMSWVTAKENLRNDARRHGYKSQVKVH